MKARGFAAARRAQRSITAPAAHPGARPPASPTALHCNGSVADASPLSSLLEVAEVLSRVRTRKPAMHSVLEILTRHHDAARSTITLLQEDGRLVVEASDGRDSPGVAVADRLTDEITGRVVETVRPIVVARAGSDRVCFPRASRRFPRREVSVVCVPIVIDRKAIGAMAVYLRAEVNHDLDRVVEMLGVVAAMLAHSISIEHAAEQERQRLEDENTELRNKLRERYDLPNIIGKSGPIRHICEQVAQVAATNTTVLIRGEHGTGKELIAHAIHYNSLRAKKPLVKVNCVALPAASIEAELFGREKGACADTLASEAGGFELAEGGTLFLDEIGDINLAAQARVLRVLQQGEFERVGGSETIRASVRIIAATNKNLESAIADGTFRRDLYERLSRFTMFVPPLRDRKADLPLLIDHFVEKLSRRHRKVIRRVSTSAFDALMTYHWSGNVGELENAVERAVLDCEGQVIHARHLAPTLQTETSATRTTRPLAEAVEAYERELLIDALRATRGNRAKAARLLSTTARIMNYRVKQLGIESGRFKA